MYIVTDTIFLFVFSEDELDLSDEMPSSSSEDESDEVETLQEEKEASNWRWNWTTKDAPMPAFPIDLSNEGGPAALPHFSNKWRPVDFFMAMFPPRIVQLAKEETNRYASQNNAGIAATVNPAWRSVTEEELFRFLAILLTAGALRVRNMNLLWSKKNPSVVKLPSVAHVMPEYRWKQIKRYFHLVDNTKLVPAGSEKYDPLVKVRLVYECLQERFRIHWKLGQFVSLDESMTAWKGRSRFKQYIRSKPIRWGFKFFCLADPISGYFKEFILYTGKKTVEKKYGLCTDAVLELVKKSNLENSNVVIVADNYYTSPLLLALLASKGCGFIGTCQLTRKHVPVQLVKFSERPGSIVRGAYKSAVVNLSRVSSSLPNVPMYCVSWYDTRAANFLATAGGLMQSTVTRRKRNGNEEEVPAPVLVKMYNRTMGGVDRADQNKGRYSVAAVVKTRKWWFRIFCGLLDMAITNAWQLYRYKVTGEEKLNHLQFILAVCDGLLITSTSLSSPSQNSRANQVGMHRLIKQEKPSRCVICSSKRTYSRTMWMCNICQYAMCAEDCFSEYHDSGFSITSNFKKRTAR